MEKTASLTASDERAGEGAVAPRVALTDIEAKVAHCVFFTGDEAAVSFGATEAFPDSLGALTVCLLTMANGFTVVGKSAPASLENFDAAKGREFAYEDAMRQLWPLEGYALRERLSARPEEPPAPTALVGTPLVLTLAEEGGVIRRFREC